MTPRDAVLAAFRGASGDSDLWLPDLTLWHHWHSSRGTLPAEYGGLDLAGVAADALGVPAWSPVPPVARRALGVTITQTQTEAERMTQYDTPVGQMTARWMLMPDGDWWQTEYPVKSEDDVPAMRADIEGESYVVDLAPWHSANAAVGERRCGPDRAAAPGLTPRCCTCSSAGAMG